LKNLLVKKIALITVLLKRPSCWSRFQIQELDVAWISVHKRAYNLFCRHFGLKYQNLGKRW
jgi:hypothetical protein